MENLDEKEIERKEKKKAYQREYYKKWYANPKNAKDKKANAKLHRDKQIKRNRAFVWQHKIENPCDECGEKRPQCLDFHHATGEKEANIADMVPRRLSLKRIKSEIKKCVILCKNCHADLHFKEKGD